MKKIPISEQRLLRASIYINTFRRAIEELVYNALDAASSSIAIRVCLEENSIQVLDNGYGISEENFSMLGQKYATSKYIDITTLKSAPDKYGFKGLALASIVDVSQSVQISSRHENSKDTWMKTFYNGKENDIRKTITRPSKGTTVVINGFLYNLNIQRKSIEPHNEILSIKTALQQLSLAHCNVSISLRDDSTNEIIFQVHKNRSIHDTMRYMFEINVNNIQELQVEKNEYKVKAFIGQNSDESYNCYQWIYINGIFIHKSIIHKRINESLSRYLRVHQGNKRPKKVHVYEDETIYYNSNIPLYFIFITCPNYGFDMNYNSEKSLVEFKDWNAINKLIEKLLQFYIDTIVCRNKEIKKIKKAEKKTDTKIEIKEVMEKILNNKNKPTKISQLLNGIKGKNLKRKRKTQVVLNELYEVKNPCQLMNSPKLSDLKKSKDSLKQQTTNFKTTKYSQLAKKDLSIHVPKEKTSNKNVIFEKGLKDLFIKQFQTTKAILRKQCKYQRQRVNKLLNKSIFKNHSCVKNPKHSYINDETQQYQTVAKKSGTLFKESYKQLEHIPTAGNKSIITCLNNQIIKKSSDLIVSVLSSQYNTTKCKDKFSYCGRSNEKQSIPTEYKNTSIPMQATYNSHKNYIDVGPRKKYCISEESRKNVFVNEEALIPISNTNICKQVTLLVNKNSKQNKKSYNSNVQNKEMELKSTIEMNDGHGITHYSTNTLHTMNYKARDNNHIESFRSEKTFLLENFTRSPHNHDNYNIKKTLQFNTSNYYSPLEVISSFMQSILADKTNHKGIGKDNVIVPESESDSKEIMPNSIEPINNCEVLLRGYSDELQSFVHEFDNTFVNKKCNVTLSNYFVQNKNSYDEAILSGTSNFQPTTSNSESNKKLNDSQSINNINEINNWEELLKSKRETLMQSIEIHKNLNAKNNSNSIDKNIDRNDLTFNFQLKSRYRFVPKGMSPIANNQYKLQNKYKLTGHEIYYEDMIYQNFAKDILLNTEIYKPDVQNIINHFSDNKDKANYEVQKRNADLIFDSVSLTQAKILGQVDRKFIASILKGRCAQTGKRSDFFILFDQHAVDERIRVETNLNDYVQGSYWKSINIDPVSIVLSKNDHLYLVNYRDKFACVGLQWKFTSDNGILLHAIPRAIMGKNPRQVEIIIKAVKKLIAEQIEAIKSLRGNISLYPKSIMELVFSEACRYAIMFGDKLTKRECQNMINSLAYCKSPFQCAHGRPVMAVLMELKYNNRIYEINLAKVKSFYRRTAIKGARIL